MALHRCYYRLFKKPLPKARLQAHLARLRNARSRAHWKTVGSQTVQAITDRLYLGWDAFFKGDIKRPPTFRARRRYRSFTLKQAGYKILGHGRLRLLGRNYRFNQSRPITGNIKTVTVRRDAIGDVYVTFSCEGVQQPEAAPKTGLSAGADFGLRTFLTLSNGERIAAPQPLKARLRQLRKVQRVLSRKQTGSRARKRARLAVARVHRKVANVRSDWHWKMARDLVERFDLLAFETLNLQGMQRLWGRKIGDLGFADFLRKAEWMAGKLGKELLKIGRWEPSTKTCRVCGYEQHMPLDVRIFVCDSCGHVEHRDDNASKNILEAGRRLRSGASSKTRLGGQDALVTAESHAL